MGEEETCALVIDSGSNTIRAGFAGDDAPRSVFPSMIGRPKLKATHGHELQDAFIGDEAWAKRGILNMKFPVEHGFVTSWVDMEKIWHHTFYNELCAAPEEHPVVLSEPPGNPKANREKTTQIMFENFSVPAMHLKIQAALSLLSSGRLTGMVLDSGHSASYAVPIHDGNALPHAVCRVNLGGRDLTQYMINIISKRLIGEYMMTPFDLSNTVGREIVRDIKEKLAYVPMSFCEEKKKYDAGFVEEKEYELPDGRMLKVGSERFHCGEVLFKPSLAQSEALGVHDVVYHSIMKCDVSLRHCLYANIVLAGGSTMLPGIAERFNHEMHILAPCGVKIKILAPYERRYSTWIGGSILASLATFQSMCVTKEEYDDCGPGIVHRMCT